MVDWLLACTFVCEGGKTRRIRRIYQHLQRTMPEWSFIHMYARLIFHGNEPWAHTPLP
jgi:hypothetical protein